MVAENSARALRSGGRFLAALRGSCLRQMRPCEGFSRLEQSSQGAQQNSNLIVNIPCRSNDEADAQIKRCYCACSGRYGSRLMRRIDPSAGATVASIKLITGCMSITGGCPARITGFAMSGVIKRSPT